MSDDLAGEYNSSPGRDARARGPGVVDPDALDRLFETGSAGVSGRVEFSYADYRVTVTVDDDVYVYVYRLTGADGVRTASTSRRREAGLALRTTNRSKTV
jgi:hypothetical protein